MKYLFLIILLLIVTGVSAQYNYRLSPPTAPHLAQSLTILKNPKDPHVLVVAHRADWRNSPENSISAIKNAIAMGVDIVEIDLHKTKDGQLVVMHDLTLDRTTNGSGKIADWTLDSIKTLFLKDGLGQVTIHKIPTLEEALMAVKGKILVNLDQSYDYFAQAYNILKKTGTLNQAIIKSPYPAQRVMAENGQYLKKMMYMPVVNLEGPGAFKMIKDYQTLVKPVAFEIIFKSDTSTIINKIAGLKKTGGRFWVNSLWDRLCGGHGDERAVINPEENYGWMLGKGFNMVQTDRPSFLINYLKKKKLH